MDPGGWDGGLVFLPRVRERTLLDNHESGEANGLKRSSCVHVNRCAELTSSHILDISSEASTPLSVLLNHEVHRIFIAIQDETPKPVVYGSEQKSQIIHQWSGPSANSLLLISARLKSLTLTLSTSGGPTSRLALCCSLIRSSACNGIPGGNL